ncbi:hypothetical protein [Ancylobacter terrae]|uniref:hypothetical protein n=1 Tax=Ancylobacter sp. sgz301288 TaxID=3342077 RepID=UPI00385828ED
MTADELARVLGVAPRTVRELAARGLVVRVSARGRYDLAASVATYCAHLREQAAGRGGDAQAGLTVKKARLTKALADQAEMKRAAMLGEMVSAAAVTAEWSGIFRRLRARVLAVPSRVQQGLPFLKPHDVDVIDAELRQALDELGNDGAPA